MALTDLGVRKLGAKNERYEVTDCNGLYLRIAPSGLKTWIFRYQFDGRPRRMTIGQFPGVGIAAARERHAQAMQDLQNGVDPGRKAIAEKQKRKTVPTFKDLLDEFWDVELSKKPTGAESWRLVMKDAFQYWKNRKVADITRRDAVILIDRVRHRAPIAANRVQGVLVRMFNFASERGIIEHSPLNGLRRMPERARSRVLSDDEIKALWAALDLGNKSVDIYRVTKLALKLILLTGQRPGEVAGAAWAEIDQENKFWDIPANRMKNAEPQRVPLCPMALEIIEEARFYSSQCPYVFQSSYKPGEPLSRPAITRAIGRHWSEIGFKEAFTPHDLRRTVRTKLAELGVNDIVAERVLGHKLQGIMAVYNRHSYDIEKRQALMAWERRLAEIIGQQANTKSNVIALRRH